ncbi:MAG: hypothetical protein ACYS0G_16435, partial [Planctomycetota bacterium]
MKSKVTLFGLLFLSLALVITLPGAMASIGGDGTSLDGIGGGFGFGQRIAGTYFSPAGFGGTLTLHADGNVSAMSGACCGSGGGNNIQSEAWGNWERTGPYQIVLRTVVVATQYDPVTALPTGNFIATPAAEIEFDQEFPMFEGSLCT